MKKRRKRLREYINKVRCEFGLVDWTICIIHEEPSGNAIASCQPIYGRKLANLRFSDAFFDCTPEEQRQTIIHELLHCHFAQAQHWCENQMKPVKWQAYIFVHEAGVDAVAVAVAEKFPLPPKF